MGISGGEEGARNGPSLMPGGPRVAYDLIEPILSKCAAQVNDGPCSGYVGPVGSGNYVKMVHNGIEYGDMQLIAEVYDIMRTILGLGNEEMASIFEEWNKTELDCYLIEITAKVLSKKDDETGEGYVTDYILDKTGELFRTYCSNAHMCETIELIPVPICIRCISNKSIICISQA
jgi:6-phosphogluconate dehydrogenase